MKQLQIIVCDDSRTSAETIAGTVERLLRSHGAACTIQTFSNPENALAYCRKTGPDLVFLDIDMPKLDGISLGHALMEMPSAPEIIFVSGREDRVFQALQVRPFGFVRKGQFMKDIADTLQAFAKHWQEKTEERKLMVTTRTDTFSIPVLNITYIECTAAVQQIYLSTQQEPLRITSRMQKLEKELAPDGFIRVHKGYLVNFRWIDRILSDTILMRGGVVLPISRLKKQEIRDRYVELCSQSGAMLF